MDYLLTSFVDELIKLSSERDELEKLARSVLKDFGGGLDPTGSFTFDYGMEDARDPNSSPGARKAIGVAGGLLGGGLMVPAVISGAIEAGANVAGGPRAMGRGFLKGMHKPFTTPYRAYKAQRALGSVSKGVSPHAGDVSALKNLVDDIPGVNELVERGMEAAQNAKPMARASADSALGSARQKAYDFADRVEDFAGSALLNRLGYKGQKVRSGIDDVAEVAGAAVDDVERLAKEKLESQVKPRLAATPENLAQLPPEIAAAARKAVTSQLTKGLSGLGLAGGIGGGSAYLQYNKGYDVGKNPPVAKTAMYRGVVGLGALGATAGGIAGAASSKEDKLRNALIGAGIGGLGGALGGYGLGRLRPKEFTKIERGLELSDKDMAKAVMGFLRRTGVEPGGYSGAPFPKG